MNKPEFILEEKSVGANIDTDWSDLERFENPEGYEPPPRKSTPSATITRCYTIALSKAFTEIARSELKNKKYVNLMYSNSNKAIILDLLVERKYKSDYTLNINKGQISISCADFLKGGDILSPNFLLPKYMGHHPIKFLNINPLGMKWVVKLGERVHLTDEQREKHSSRLALILAKKFKTLRVGVRVVFSSEGDIEIMLDTSLTLSQSLIDSIRLELEPFWSIIITKISPVGLRTLWRKN